MSLCFRCDFVSGIILIVYLSGCEWSPNYQVKTEIVRLRTTDEILVIHKSIVKPILYTHVAGLDKLPTDEAKKKFISVVLPSILVAKYEIQQNGKRVERLYSKIKWNEADSLFYRKIKFRYRAKDIKDLLTRLKTPPVSIVLAQAAVESGWGESRIFTKTNNVFGVWSFNKREPRMAALVKRGNRTIYLKSYVDISRSVIDYFEIIGKAKSFGTLREVLAETGDPMLIVPHLRNYSERRTAYTNQLKSVIEKNNLTIYDHCIIDPASILAID